MASGIRLTYEEVSEYFESQGCELLEKKYKNARTKMKYRCVCGNESSIVFDSFKRGNRCKGCGSLKNKEKQTLTQKQAEDKFKDCGCELLEEYTAARIKVKYRCECGEVNHATPNNVWRGRRCMECGTKRRSGDNHYEWREDREQLKSDFTFRQRSYKLIKMVLNLTGKYKNKKSAALLGYDWKQLQDHITNHPNWDKVKDESWHVDHIFPITAFIDYGISDLKVINALENLRPLLAVENIKKGGKYCKEQFEEYLDKRGIIYEA